MKLISSTYNLLRSLRYYLHANNFLTLTHVYSKQGVNFTHFVIINGSVIDFKCLLKIVSYPKKAFFIKELKLIFFNWIEVDEAWNVSAYINKLAFRAKILLGLRKLKYWNYINLSPIPIGLFLSNKDGGGVF